MDFLISGCVMFVFGAIFATIFWLSYMRARDEGYNRGYNQAQFEESLKNPTEVVTPACSGFPSVDRKVVNYEAR